MKIYVASSWKNDYQQYVVQLLRDQGYEVYDYKHPAKDNNGFHWSYIDASYQLWSVSKFIKALEHPISIDGFNLDFEALDSTNLVVLLLNSGRSAHLEAGYVKGQGKPLIIYLHEYIEPELMYKMADYIVTNDQEMLDAIKQVIQVRQYI